MHQPARRLAQPERPGRRWPRQRRRRISCAAKHLPRLLDRLAALQPLCPLRSVPGGWRRVLFLGIGLGFRSRSRPHGLLADSNDGWSNI
eukprot:6813669-Prymnesium_polylepis.1